MRLYSITNMYTAGIHAGIQTQHSTAELFVKYPMTNSATSDKACVIFDWAKYHKTTIVLTGGMHDNLVTLLENMEVWAKHNPDVYLPFAPFYEPGINNALTSISIIMPEDAIEYMGLIRSTKPDTPEREALMLEIYDIYGKFAFGVFESIAYLPLAK